jgi:tRNA1Val (adenine37-N6)-methyltransferase
MKVTTDGCLFGAIVAKKSVNSKSLADVLDIGTGTGLLSLMLAQQNRDCHIDALEIDDHAFWQAKDNIAISPWKDRIQVIKADVKEFEFAKKYDFIFSNPPFYENELASTDEKRNQAHHGSALVFEDLCKIIKSNLKTDGMFSLLLPFKREKNIEHILNQNQLFIHEKILVRQSTKHDHFRIIISGGLIETDDRQNSEISICDDERNYTTEFTELLREYYLHL